MATQKHEPVATETEYEQLFADWVYQVPGVLLIAAGFGTLLFLTFA